MRFIIDCNIDTESYSNYSYYAILISNYSCYAILYYDFVVHLVSVYFFVCFFIFIIFSCRSSSILCLYFGMKITLIMKIVTRMKFEK